LVGWLIGVLRPFSAQNGPIKDEHRQVQLIEFHLSSVKTSKSYQLSLTNPRESLHHGKRTANKGGRSV